MLGLYPPPGLGLYPPPGDDGPVAGTLPDTLAAWSPALLATVPSRLNLLLPHFHRSPGRGRSTVGAVGMDVFRETNADVVAVRRI